MSRALTVVVEGGRPDVAKPSTGFGTGVFELAVRFRTDAFRVVYAVRMDRDAWVLHAFQKRSKSGIKTPKAETDLIVERPGSSMRSTRRR